MIVKISTSILGLDYTDQSIIDQAVMRITNANYVHFDICDGKFVKETSFDHKLVKATNLTDTGLQKDVHLMVKDPEKVVLKYIAAGANMISFHAEACKNPKKLIEKVQAKNVLCGIAINPETPISKIKDVLDVVDYVLVMTVKPGKSGQKFLKAPIKKIKQLMKIKPELMIEVDGGINDKNAGELIEAGANILVSGHYVFSSLNPKTAIDILRNA